MILELIEQYRKVLETANFDLGGGYLPAQDEELVRTKLTEIGYDYPELVAFYTWRDGVDDSKKLPKGKICFFPGYYMLGLDEAISWYKRKHLTGQFDADYFPLFCADGYDFYHFNRHAGKTEIVGMLEMIKGARDFSFETEFISFEIMLRTFIDAVDQGGVYVTKEGYLEFNDDKFIPAARVHNPGLDCYKF